MLTCGKLFVTREYFPISLNDEMMMHKNAKFINVKYFQFRHSPCHDNTFLIVRVRSECSNLKFCLEELLNNRL